MGESSSKRVSPDPPEEGEEEEEATIAQPRRSKRCKVYVYGQRCHSFPNLSSSGKREQQAAAHSQGSNHHPPAVCSQEDRNDEDDKRAGDRLSVDVKKEAATGRLASMAATTTSTAAAIDHDDNDLLLKDANGNPRGAYISLKEEESGMGVLKMLYYVYGECEKHLGRVQKYTEHLYHYNFNSPGFPLQHGSDGSQFFASFPSSHVSEMESFITQKIRDTLVDIGYCADDQELQLHLSFLKTQEKTSVQPPHIDHQWENVVPPDRFPHKRPPRSYRGNYHEWVPFIALFPLTEVRTT